MKNINLLFFAFFLTFAIPAFAEVKVSIEQTDYMTAISLPDLGKYHYSPDRNTFYTRNYCGTNQSDSIDKDTWIDRFFNLRDGKEKQIIKFGNVTFTRLIDDSIAVGFDISDSINVIYNYLTGNIVQKLDNGNYTGTIVATTNDYLATVVNPEEDIKIYNLYNYKNGEFVCSTKTYFQDTIYIDFLYNSNHNALVMLVGNCINIYSIDQKKFIQEGEVIPGKLQLLNDEYYGSSDVQYDGSGKLLYKIFGIFDDDNITLNSQLDNNIPENEVYNNNNRVTASMSSNGKKFALCYNGKISIYNFNGYNLTKVNEIKTLLYDVATTQPESKAPLFTFCNDDKSLLIGSGDNTLTNEFTGIYCVYNVETGKQMFSFGEISATPNNPVIACVFSPTQDLAYFYHGRIKTQYDYETWTNVIDLEQDTLCRFRGCKLRYKQNEVAVDNEKMYVSVPSKGIECYYSSEEKFMAPELAISDDLYSGDTLYSLVMSLDKKYLICGGQYSRIYVIDLENKSLYKSFCITEDTGGKISPIDDLRLSADGKLLYGGSNVFSADNNTPHNPTTVWNTVTWEQIKQYPMNDSLLITGSIFNRWLDRNAEHPLSPNLQVGDREYRYLEGYGKIQLVICIGYSFDDKYIFATDYLSTIYCWDAATGKLLTTLSASDQYTFTSLSISNVSNTIIAIEEYVQNIYTPEENKMQNIRILKYSESSGVFEFQEKANNHSQMVRRQNKYASLNLSDKLTTNDVNYSIYDLSGNKLFTSNSTIRSGNTLNISVENLPLGVCNLVVEHNNQTEIIKLLITE